MGLTLWVATTLRDGPACQSRSKTGGGGLRKRRSVEKSFRLSHLAWKSRPHRGIPTFPQSRRRCSLNLKPDISCALKSGQFDLLTTDSVLVGSGLLWEMSHGFSRKIQNHAAAVVQNYFANNFIQIHRTLRTSPAKAAGVTDRLWDVADLVSLWESYGRRRKEWRRLFGRLK
jgi:hypothetical protein